MGEWLFQSESERFVSGDYEGFLRSQEEENLYECDLLFTLMFDENTLIVYSYNKEGKMIDCVIFGEDKFSYSYEKLESKGKYKIAIRPKQSKSYNYQNGDVSEIITTDYEDNELELEFAEVYFINDENMTFEQESGSILPSYKSIVIVNFSRK